MALFGQMSSFMFKVSSFVSTLLEAKRKRTDIVIASDLQNNVKHLKAGGDMAWGCYAFSLHAGWLGLKFGQYLTTAGA